MCCSQFVLCVGVVQAGHDGFVIVSSPSPYVHPWFKSGPRACKLFGRVSPEMRVLFPNCTAIPTASLPRDASDVVIFGMTSDRTLTTGHGA
jgi:hypothetical protein